MAKQKLLTLDDISNKRRLFDLLKQFEETAGNKCWQEDQGTGREVDTAIKQHAEATDELVRYLRRVLPKRKKTTTTFP